MYVFQTEPWKFWDSDAYTLIHEYNREEAKNILRFKWLKPVPQHLWGAILGDALHCARSALDYIAWRLAGSDLTDRHTFFPICLTEKDWRAAQWRYRRHPIHSQAFDHIHSLQPYRRPDPERTFLWALQELDARDKHKLITLTESLARASQIEGTGQITIPYGVIEGPLQDGMIIIEYPGPPAARTDLNIHLSFQVVFDSTTGIWANLEVISILKPIFDVVDAIIGNFEFCSNWFPS